LVDTPEAALRSLFNFLSEPFAAECLTPLEKRINSSNVPADFKIGDPETDPSLVERAKRLSTEVEKLRSRLKPRLLPPMKWRLHLTSGSANIVKHSK